MVPTPPILFGSSQPCIKILPRISVTGISMSVRPSVVVALVAKGSLDLAARAIVLKAFLFHLAKIDAATVLRCAGEVNRTRGARVIRR